MFHLPVPQLEISHVNAFKGEFEFKSKYTIHDNHDDMDIAKRKIFGHKTINNMIKTDLMIINSQLYGTFFALLNDSKTKK